MNSMNMKRQPYIGIYLVYISIYVWIRVITNRCALETVFPCFLSYYQDVKGEYNANVNVMGPQRGR